MENSHLSLYGNMRRLLPEPLIFSVLIFLFHPFLVTATVPDGAIENTMNLSNSGYITISNSGSYGVSLTVSGSLDAGDTIQTDVRDSNNTLLYQNYTSLLGGETSQLLNFNFGTSSLLQGPIRFDSYVYTGGLSTNVVATLGATQTGMFDTMAPTPGISSHSENQTITGSVVTLTGNVTDTGGVANMEINGLLATLGTGTWTRTLTGLIAGTNTFTVVATDTVGNTGSLVLHLIRLSTPTGISATLSGGTTAVVAFGTDITATGVVLYGTTPGSLTMVATGATTGTAHMISLPGLTANTTYYYQVYGVSGGQIGDISSTLSFRTPFLVDVTTASGAITANGSVYLSGATATRTTFLNSGSLSILSTTESGTFIAFSFSGLIIMASGSWDQVFQGPEIVNNIPTGAGSGYTFIGNVYQIGNAYTELTLSGQTGSVTIQVGVLYAGQVLRIYRSTDGGTSYSYPMSCAVTGGGDCTFATTQFSLFALAALIDTTPNTFTFTDISSAELGAVYESNIVTIAGVNTPTAITIVGGQYSINGGPYTSLTGAANLGDTIKVRLTSSASYSASASLTLTVGGVSDTYTVITKPSYSGGGGGGGAGGPSPSISTSFLDICLDGDYSSDLHDGLCGTPPILGGTSVAAWTIIREGNDFTITITTTNGISTNMFHIPAVILGTLSEIRFRDVSNNWAREYIYKLVSRGIIDNALRYRPNDRLTRAEFLKIVINTAGWPVEAVGVSNSYFRDVNSRIWYAPYVSLALSRGMISGSTRVFRPNDPISRAEATKILITALGAKVDADILITFVDVNRNSDLTKYVETAKLLGILSGQIINGSLHFRPSEPITRAEIAKVVVNSFGL